MKVLVALAISCVFQSDSAQANVDYGQQDEWGGKCNTGYEQSPIDIDTNYVVQDKKLPALEFGTPEEPMSAIATNIGHTVQFNFSGGLRTLAGTGLEGTYNLHYLYFHWPSEHTVNGRHFSLEAHWGHYNKRYSTVEKASEHEDGVVILVTFYEVGAEEGLPAIDQFADAIESVAERVGLQTPVGPFTLDVPAHSKSFFKYRGSDTVPPCPENVTYVLLEEPVAITEAQYQKITSVSNQNGKRVESNNRRIQPLNGRKVYYRLQPAPSV